MEEQKQPMWVSYSFRMIPVSLGIGPVVRH